MSAAYITPAKVFAHTDRIAGWKAGATPAPVTIEADLTNRCYLRCQGCHFAYTHTRGPWTMGSRTLPIAQDRGGDLADVGVTRRWLSQAADFGVRGVIWTGGGEPTLHPHWLEILRHARAVGLQQGMYTAGGLLTAETARTLASLATWVVISLDAADADAYAREKGVPRAKFDAACAGTRALTAAKGATVGVSFLLHATNWTHTAAMLSTARALGASYTTFRPLIDTAPDRPGVPRGGRAWVTDALPTLQALAAEPDVQIDPSRFAAYRDWNGHGYPACHGIKFSTTITPDGRMWLCPNRREFTESCLGDLRREFFAEIWGRHPKTVTDFTQCRAMCRLHLMNQALTPVFAPQAHEAFV